MAYFGLKDYQQYLIIKKMAAELNLPVKIVGCPIIREKDGLAMSSRNTYLSAEEHRTSLFISASMAKAQERFQKGERQAPALKRTVEEMLHSGDGIDIEYVSICDSETLEEVNEIRSTAVLAIACRVGKTRLIDNIIFTEA